MPPRFNLRQLLSAMLAASVVVALSVAFPGPMAYAATALAVNLPVLCLAWTVARDTRAPIGVFLALAAVAALTWVLSPKLDVAGPGHGLSPNLLSRYVDHGLFPLLAVIGCAPVAWSLDARPRRRENL